MKVINLLFILLCISACNISKVRSSESLNDSISLEPHAVILLQPYDDFSQDEARKLSYKLLEKLNTVYCGQWEIKVLQNKSLPNKAYYKLRNRYLANELLKDLPNTNSPIYIIGVTHKDISFKIHGYANYGIMGLSPLGGNKSVVSDFRVKGNDFIATILHEFGHGFYGLEHCSNPTCLMCDYQKHKGRPFSFKLCKEHAGV